MPLGQLAQQYTLCDNFFHSAFGGSWPNHMWLISARTPYWPAAPQSMIAELDADGVLIPGTRQDAEVTPDGFAVNTVFPFNEPHPQQLGDGQQYLPPQSYPTISDRLSRRGVSWAWYADGWDDAIAGHPDPTFQFHHQPFAYFTRFFMLAFEELVSAQPINRTMFRGGHEPGARVVRDTRLRPPLQRNHQHVVRQALGQADVAHDPREVGDELGRLDPPDSVHRATRYARMTAYVTLAYVDGLVLDKVRVMISKEAFDKYERSAVIGHDVKDVRVRALRRTPDGAGGTLPVVSFHNARGVVLSECVADKDTPIFLSLSGEQTANVLLVGNHLQPAIKPYVLTGGASIKVLEK